MSEKPIVRLDQISDPANDCTYLFITDEQGKQWRQLLEQKTSGFTWCGANEAASIPKTPTLEKAASYQRSNPDLAGEGLQTVPNPQAYGVVSDEDFTTRVHRVAASLKQRLSASRKLFDRKSPGHNGNSTDFLTVPNSGSTGSDPSCIPEPTTAKVGDTQLLVLTNCKGQKVISGLFRDTAILTSHNHELEVLPQVAFKLPKQTHSVLLLDKLMLVKVGQWTLKAVSSHHCEINLDKTKEDPVLQTFTMPKDEIILGFHKIKVTPKFSISTSTTPTSSDSSSKDDNVAETNTISDPCDQLTKEVQAKVESAKAKGQAMVQPCLIVTSKAIYLLQLDEDPISAVLDLVAIGKSKDAEKLAITFELDSKTLYELAADIKLTKMDYAGAINLYRFVFVPLMFCISTLKTKSWRFS